MIVPAISTKRNTIISLVYYLLLVILYLFNITLPFFNSSLVAPSVMNSTSFSLLFSRDADPPVFTIGFNVTVRPPTIVMCTLDDMNLNIPDSDIHRVVLSAVDPNILVEVIVILRMRVAGDYKCSAEHNIEDDNIIGTPETDTITVTGE